MEVEFETERLIQTVEYTGELPDEEPSVLTEEEITEIKNSFRAIGGTCMGCAGVCEFCPLIRTNDEVTNDNLATIEIDDISTVVTEQTELVVEKPKIIQVAKEKKQEKEQEQQKEKNNDIQPKIDYRKLLNDDEVKVVVARLNRTLEPIKTEVVVRVSHVEKKITKTDETVVSTETKELHLESDIDQTVVKPVVDEEIVTKATVVEEAKDLKFNNKITLPPSIEVTPVTEQIIEPKNTLEIKTANLVSTEEETIETEDISEVKTANFLPKEKISVKDVIDNSRELALEEVFYPEIISANENQDPVGHEECDFNEVVEVDEVFSSRNEQSLQIDKETKRIEYLIDETGGVDLGKVEVLRDIFDEGKNLNKAVYVGARKLSKLKLSQLLASWVLKYTVV
jgi:hypothetical protein